jgi:PIN domain nuclease of toxin-antitoxin system
VIILDASPVIAYMKGEPGADVVESYLTSGAAISPVCLAEVYAHLLLKHPEIIEQDLVQAITELDMAETPPTARDAMLAGALQRDYKKLRLSLADRLCLAQGVRLRQPILTGDHNWLEVGADLGIDVIHFRPRSTA